MKNNFRTYLSNAGTLMILANFLHNVLLSRGRWDRCNVSQKKKRNIDKKFEEAFKRLCQSVDFRAKTADKVLKCKIASGALINGGDGVCINILTSRRDKNKKSYNKK